MQKARNLAGGISSGFADGLRASESSRRGHPREQLQFLFGLSPFYLSQPSEQNHYK